MLFSFKYDSFVLIFPHSAQSAFTLRYSVCFLPRDHTGSQVKALQWLMSVYYRTLSWIMPRGGRCSSNSQLVLERSQINAHNVRVPAKGFNLEITSPWTKCNISEPLRTPHQACDHMPDKGVLRGYKTLHFVHCDVMILQ